MGGVGVGKHVLISTLVNCLNHDWQFSILDNVRSGLLFICCQINVQGIPFVGNLNERKKS